MSSQVEQIPSSVADTDDFDAGIDHSIKYDVLADDPIYRTYPVKTDTHYI